VEIYANLTENRKVLILNPNDNIGVCLEDLSAGTQIRQANLFVLIQESITRGHKIAIRDISKDEGIIKYGERMGHAITAIAAGEHVHVHNVLGDRLSTQS
jgi:altronate hydrolase